MSRQVGKSNVASTLVFTRIIEESRDGFDYLVMGPIEKTINELFIGNVIIEAFGGKEVVPNQDINCVWIPTPKKYKANFKEQKTTLNKLMSSDLAFVTDLCEYEKWVQAGLLSEDLQWVKLFHEDLKPGGRGKGEDYQGKLFTGARMTFASSNNPNLDAIIRGRQFNGVWVDEIGETKIDIRSIYTAGVNTKSGWVLYTGTPPNKPKNPWVYTTVINPVINNPNISKKRYMGVDFYNFSRNSIDPDTGEKYNFNSYLAIGKLENVWQYVYQGKKRLIDANRTRPVSYMPKYLLDEQGDKIPEETGCYTVGGEKIVVGYQFEMIPDTDNGVTTGDEEAYQREYQVAFDNVADKVFNGFSINNVIARKDFNPSNYKIHVLGFDYGSKDRTGDTTLKNRSSTAWCKVAVVPDGDAFQYIIYDCQYINKPNELEIANCWNQNLKDGLLIVADSALWSEVVFAGSNVYSTFTNALPELKANRLSRTNEGVFKCFKWNSNTKKAEKFNEYFAQSHITKQRPYFNISKPLEPGRKIMVTDNCVELINFLITYGYKVKKIVGTDISEQSLPEVGDDLYDAMTYAVDFIEKFERGSSKEKGVGWQLALKFKRKYDQWEGSINQPSQPSLYNSFLSAIGSRQRF